MAKAEEKNKIEAKKAEAKTDKSAAPVKAEAKTDKTKKAIGESVYARKRQEKGAAKKKNQRRTQERRDEYEQRVIDIARVTRVMAGGKRMRFRATVAIGDKKGKIGLGMAKGADVAVAVNKAVNNAKKAMIEISIVNGTIPHEIYHKYGAGKVLLKPARLGKGVIAGGAIRTMLELVGLNNVTSKNLGTNNKVTIAKCLMEALDLLKKVEVKKPKNTKKVVDKKEVKEEEKKVAKKVAPKKEIKK
ncbi:30S ribosomal protein S5 [Candidatus Parcubacteria bacterium]|nr:MAG: 30S ribosomal protein S5 [Candidatus Parcubacteria bacterium]